MIPRLMARVGTALLGWAAFACPAAEPVAKTEGEKAIVGAIRWDAWYGTRGEVVKSVETSLGPPKYHFRLPWFARVVGLGKVGINGDSQEIMEREIGYAARAGLDYWAFVDYGYDPELTIAIRRYRAAKDKRGLRYCLVEEGDRLDGLGTGEWPRLVGHFKGADYQTVLGGRSLLYVFGKTEKLGKREWQELSDTALAAVGKRPYMVFMGWHPEEDAKTCKALGFDAISAYAGGWAYSMNPPTYAEQCEALKRGRWDVCRQLHVPCVAFVSTGWDTRPRNEHPPPWVRSWVGKGTPDQTPPELQKPLIDAVTATPGQIAAHLQEAVDWTRRNGDINPSRAVIVYAWNENDEGGWLIPTLGRDGEPDTGRVEAVRGVLRPEWRDAPPPSGKVLQKPMAR